MANAASTIEIELEIRQAIGRLNSLQKELNQTTQNFNKAADSTRNFEVAIGKAKTAAVAFFSVVTAKKIAEFSDVMTQFENRVKLATNSLNQQIAVQGELIKVAQQTATPLADIGELYSRMRLAAEQLGASQRDLINLTKTVGLTLKTQGTSATEASGALQQLGQAFTSPIVQAEEFNSIQDALPALLVQVTKNLGLQQGQLKKYVNDQKLSNKDLFDAILASQKALEQQANLAANTFESFGTRVNNTVTSSIGALSRFMGAKLTKEFTNFKEAIFDTFPALDSFMTKLGKALTIGPGLLDKFTRLVVLGEQPPEEGGGEANLDEIIKDQTNLITDLEASFKGLSIYATTQIMAISEAFEDSNLTIEEYTKKVEAFVKSYTEFYDKADSGELPGFPSLQFDPETQEQLFLSAEQARKEFELIFKFIAQGFKAFENLNGEAEKYLTYLERITNYLSEQLRLLELSEENANRTAGAIVSGISAAGPNASRAMNIAQSKSPEEAAAKLILSNEKVAAAIEEYFTILFDTIDPLIDILADLQSAINRLAKALIEGVGNAIERNLDAIGLGPNSYYGGGGFTRDIEALGGGATGGAYQPTDSEALQIAAIKDLRDIVDGQDETLKNLLDAAKESGNLVGVVELFKQSINNLIPSLVSVPDLQTYQQILDRLNENVATGIIGDNLQEVVDYYQDLIDETTGELPRAEAYVAVGTAELIIQELASQISGTGTSVSDFEGISDLVTKTAQEQIDSIHFQNLTAEEQIHFRNEETVAMLNAQKIFIQLIDDEERRADLLTKIAAAEAKQLELYNLQLSELQKLNEEREREARLLAIQNIETGLQALLSDFERTIEKINDLVQGLFDQVNDLLFSEFNLASPQDAFAMASDEYQDLLGKAFEPEATEEDIKNLQGFVNEYLSASKDVYKSSSAFQEIFDNVLQDLTKLGISYGFNAPINAVSGLQKDLEAILVDLPEDLQQAVSDLISGLNLAATAFAQQQVEFLTTVYQIPLTLNKENFNISLPIVELGEIQVDFDTYEFANELGLLNLNVENGINNLNKKISSAINSFIQTINNASSAVESGGTATPVETVTPSGTNQSGEVYTPPTYATKIYELAASGKMIDYTNVSDLSNSDSYFYIQRTATDHGSTTVEDYAKAFVSSYEDAFGVGAAAKFKYGLYSDFGLSRYFIGYTNTTEGIQARDSNYEAYKNYSTKYGFRHGGIVDAMDTIPAMLSPGEYILSPETVRRYGVSNLNRLNSGDSAAINATSDPEVKRLLAELIVAVRENDTEVNVYTDMQGQAKAGIEEFRSELRERTRRQGDKFLPARYI